MINTAAYTFVDRAEQEPLECHAVNATAVGQLADACDEFGSRLVQISTDYVFGGPAGTQPYREQDPTFPCGQYAQSKFAGEQLATRCQRHLIVRTCGLYGRSARATRPATLSIPCCAWPANAICCES